MIRLKNIVKTKQRSIPLTTAVAAILFLASTFLAVPARARDEGIESLKETGKAFASVARKVSPAVVFIKIEKKMEGRPIVQYFSPFGEENPFGDDLLKRFFGIPSPDDSSRRNQQVPRRQEVVVGQGTGFIITDDGYIMTNNHVVSGADKIVVKLEDGREFEATVVGRDPHSDVAVIRIGAADLPVLRLGDSDAVDVGEWVVAIGNPFGLSHTLTAGVVSAKGRSGVGITDYESFIQTDAAINPGNSGGPLVNLDGKAVGMNTAIASRNGGYMGIGFAIPINMAKAIGDQLIATGSVARGYLGILIQDLTPALAETFGVADSKGILVSQVTENSPAKKAGLKAGDVIVGINGKPANKVGAFRNSVALMTPGTGVRICVLRDGSKVTFDVTIGRLPDGDLNAGVETHTLDRLGLTVETASGDQDESSAGVPQEGVVVTRVESGSVAALAGIRPGMLIREVNRRQIANVKEFKQAVDRASEKGSVLLLIQDGRYSRYLVLKVE